MCVCVFAYLVIMSPARTRAKGREVASQQLPSIEDAVEEEDNLLDAESDDDADIYGEVEQRGTLRSGTRFRHLQRGHYHSIDALAKSHKTIFAKTSGFTLIGKILYQTAVRRIALTQVPFLQKCPWSAVAGSA